MVLGQEVHYYIIYIAEYTELNKNCNYASKRCFCCENNKYVADENFCGHFCPRRKAANFCHPAGYYPPPVHFKISWNPTYHAAARCIINVQCVCKECLTLKTAIAVNFITNVKVSKPFQFFIVLVDIFWPSNKFKTFFPLTFPELSLPNQFLWPVRGLMETCPMIQWPELGWTAPR